MTRLLFFCLLVICICPGLLKNLEIFNLQDRYPDFTEYLNEYNIEFKSTQDYKERYEVFLTNKMIIDKMNNAGLSYKLKINQFGHWTREEYQAYLKTGNGRIPYETEEISIPEEIVEIKDIDYRALGAVSRVKNQEHCFSCWAFSAVGAIESQYILHTKKNTTFSEQELVDCSGEEGNDGCNGGLMNFAFEYVKKHGITDEQSYPYTSTDGDCKAESCPNKIYVRSISYVKKGNETSLATKLIKNGPVSVAIDASSIGFQFYHSGVYESDSCSSEDLDHGVLLVGIGSHPSKHYIVKNSWGSNWGDHGYILMARDRNNMCGIATDASVPVLQIPQN